MRVNQGQEFVIGGYTPTAGSFDALIFGYYEGGELIYVARTRNGFTPRSRLDLLKRLRKLETPACPFANLPGAEGRALGARAHGREDGGMPLGEAGVGRAVRVRRMDPGQSSAAFAVRFAP
jgi:ATP-dependent DNA ligase